MFKTIPNSAVYSDVPPVSDAVVARAIARVMQHYEEQYGHPLPEYRRQMMIAEMNAIHNAHSEHQKMFDAWVRDGRPTIR